jgi:5'-nucleotidase
MIVKERIILLTNDDGIQSPGLWTAAKALSELGYVYVAAPRDQFSGAGRSFPITSDGIIRPQSMHVNGKDWTVYAIGGTPSQVVMHAILEILPDKPDLVVAGINYGENLSTGVSASGTIGAALEGAAWGIPAMGISQETESHYHLSYSEDIDFRAAGYFTAYFGRILLEKKMPFDVDVLKIDVPANATPDTPWELTRLARKSYYEPLPPERLSWDQPARVGYRESGQPQEFPIGTDVHTLRVKQAVSVTPLSLDMTSRVELAELEKQLRNTSK